MLVEPYVFDGRLKRVYVIVHKTVRENIGWKRTSVMAKVMISMVAVIIQIVGSLVALCIVVVKSDASALFLRCTRLWPATWGVGRSHFAKRRQIRRGRVKHFEEFLYACDVVCVSAGINKGL